MKHPIARLANGVDEPYRIFFPLGTLWSFIGVAYWIGPGTIPGFGTLDPAFHIWMQIYGFLGAFVIGFLGTAAPRLTRTAHMEGIEVAMLLGLHGLCMLGLFREAYELAHGAYALSLLVFTAFLIPRFAKRERTPPANFIFVPVGVICGIVGAGLLAVAARENTQMSAEMQTLAKTLVTQAQILCLVIGVGGYLVRSILGWLNQGDPSGPPMIVAPTAKTLAQHGACAALLVAAFPIEAFVHHGAGALLKATVVSIQCLWQLRIHHRPRSGKLGAYPLLIAAWLLVLGLWADVFVAAHLRVAVLHLCFVGGFGITTIAVATRVILAHAGFGNFLSRNVVPIAWAHGLMILGGLTRATADFLPKTYRLHLTYAAIAWCLGLGLWAGFTLYRVALLQPPKKT